MTDTAHPFVTFRDLRAAARRLRVLLLTILLAPAAATVVWYALMPRTYVASVLVDMVRIGRVTTSPDTYAYDDYYRLEADRQFAVTIEQWLRTPRVAEDIITAAGLPVPDSLRDRERFFAARRISSQSVTVEYGVRTPEAAARVAAALADHLDRRTGAADLRQGTAQTAVPRVSEPVVAVRGPSLPVAVLVATVCGAALAGFLVLAAAAHRRG